MTSLNLSSNGPSITKSYQSVLDSPAPSGPAAASPTYGQWAVFSVSTPLVSAFQQDSASKESVLKVQSTGEGELVDLVEDFSDGRVQFAYVKVKDPNTGLPKNILIGWCGEGVPERTKGYFTSHLAAVSRFMHGYHVQITARSDRDLTPEGIVQKVADSSGSKYSAGDQPAIKTAPKPDVASKPVFTPSRTVGSFKPLSGSRPAGGARDEGVDDDGWGADAPPVTRTQLEKVQPAYKPTKVNMDDLVSQKSSTTSSTFERNEPSPSGDVVKGTYQPVGKVDIAAIRRQAQESGQSTSDRPAPVKGSYEPVGKVDIASIRAKAQGTPDTPRSPPSNVSPAVTGGSGGSEERKSLAERSAAFNAPERLTTLPKPKVANKFGGGSSFTGTKAPLPGGFEAKPVQPSVPVGTASRTFADEGGKTPAQIWAEKKAKERGTIPSQPAAEPQPLQSQGSGQGGWKSSYTGKSWAPVQTTHTGASSRSADARDQGDETLSQQDEPPQPGNMGAIRERFANGPPMGAPAPVAHERTVPPPPLDESTKPNRADEPPAPSLPLRGADEGARTVPPPPQQPRSPTPEPASPVETGSPIRVAMPVGRGSADEHVAGAHDEQQSPPPVLPTRALSDRVPDERELEEEPAHDPARATAEAAAASSHAEVSADGGIQALVHYDYERTEDDDLEIHEGEYVTNIDMVDDNWWMGINARGEQGLFPCNYVTVVGEPDDGDQHAEPGDLEGASAVALYDYDAAEDNEIGFPDGAMITNIRFVSDNWWQGEYNGRDGLFPATYVHLSE